MQSRRHFLASLTAALATQAPTTRPNLAQIDRTRILKAAASAPPIPTSRRLPDSPEFLAFSLFLPALAAASVVDPANGQNYAASAATQLQFWLLDPETRLDPAPVLKEIEPIELLSPLAELAVGLPFLALPPEARTAAEAWFKTRLTWLTEDRAALLARDARSHHGSSWLLQTSAAARLLANETILNECRHRFKTSTIRAQIDGAGLFPHELTTENPFRNSLYNLDLLAGSAVLLSTRFENIWDHELQDGPGMRSAIAKHAFYIANRLKWPYPADVTHFNLLPGRRPALVFAGRAFSAPDYVTLWRTLDPDPTNPDILRTFPIREPILWLPQTHAATVERALLSSRRDLLLL